MINTKNSTVGDWVMLFIGIGITIIFMFFSEPIYTCLYLGSDEFADKMYDYNLYFTLATFTSVAVWFFAILYYWILDMVKLSSFGGWALFCLFAICVVPAIAYFYPMNVFDMENLNFDTDLPGLAIITLPITLIYYFLISVCIKGLSTNCSTRPF